MKGGEHVDMMNTFILTTKITHQQQGPMYSMDKGKGTGFQPLLLLQASEYGAEKENEWNLPFHVEELEELMNDSLLLEMEQSDLVMILNLLHSEKADDLSLEDRNALIQHVEELLNENNAFLFQRVVPTLIKQDIPEANLFPEVVVQLIEDIRLFFKIYREENGFSSFEIAARFRTLLEDWSLLYNQGQSTEMNNLLANELTEEEREIWEELVKRYENRTHYVKQNIYRQDAGVSKQDVLNWLQQAMANHQSSEQQNGKQEPIQATSQIPMSTVEQYDIHVQSMNKVEGVRSEMVNKFMQIVQKSHFLMRNNQQMGLSITLRPEQLGNMHVRFQQVNGEMIVKIVVSSQMAKDMLDSHVHQLKHLFSPHQVVIERDESIAEEELYTEEHYDEEQQEEQLDDDQQKQYQNQQEDALELEFETILNEISKEVDGI